MKTAKEIANDLGIQYCDFIGFLKCLKINKFMGVYRFNENEIQKIKLLIDTGLNF
jgi:hypothetical protein